MSEIPSVHINPSIGSRFKSALIPAPLVQIITGGLVTGLLQVVLSISYATLVFRGELSPYVGQGIGFALVGAFIISTVVSLFSSLPGTVGSNQDVSVAIFSLISASILANMPPGASFPRRSFLYPCHCHRLNNIANRTFLFVFGCFSVRRTCSLSAVSRCWRIFGRDGLAAVQGRFFLDEWNGYLLKSS